MGRIDVILPEELEEKLRQEVYIRKGLKRGNLTESLKEAVVLWIENKNDSTLNHNPLIQNESLE